VRELEPLDIPTFRVFALLTAIASKAALAGVVVNALRVLDSFIVTIRRVVEEVQAQDDYASSLGERVFLSYVNLKIG
jgi:hypothetical protein